MRIAAHIGVKDEVELIDKVINHLCWIGVDCFIVCDMYSTDGTAEILESYKSDDFQILKIANSDPGEVWLRKNEEAVKAIDADWLVFVDADEFLLPASGSLRESLSMADAELLSVPKYNVPLGPNGPMLPEDLVPSRYSEIQLIVKTFPQFRKHLLANPTTPLIRVVPTPKVIVRPQRLGSLTDGMHDIVPAGSVPLRRIVSKDIIIAHLPLTSAGRLARKVENIQEYFRFNDSYFDGDKGWHWRRWLELAARGELESEFTRSLFTHEILQELAHDGVIRSAAEMLGLMARTGGSAAQPLNWLGRNFLRLWRWI
jgi:glycosyltransferase involved in cell wall biosynthesis